MVHYRARRELDNELWQDLHQLYQTAEQAGVAMTTVSAGHRSKSVSTCNEVYVRALLLALANPLRRSPRASSVDASLGDDVGLQGRPRRGGRGRAGLRGRPRHNQPPTWVKADVGEADRAFLETTNLRRSVRSRVKKLESGVDPQTLGLGKDCVQPDVGRLLVSARARVGRVAGAAPVHAPPVSGARRARERARVDPRRDQRQGVQERRRGATGTTRAATPSRSTSTRARAPSEAARTRRAAFTAEKWETLDESANGFRIRRKGPGERLSLGQLVGLRPAGARGFILSEVRWLMAGIDGSLTVGASALPGLAKAVAVRPASTPNNAPEAYVQAFLLPNAAAQPSSLVMPSGWYQQARELEVRDEDELDAREARRPRAARLRLRPRQLLGASPRPATA